jgi:hypothetical protein
VPDGVEPAGDRAPALRASDADRERTVALLRDGAADGRLTFDELAQRVERACSATTAGELERLIEDLPAPVPEARPATALRRRRWNVAVMGGCTRRGRWRPAAHGVALALMGGVELDFREATIEDDAIVVTAIAVIGGVDIVVPEGVEVDMGGFALMGGNDYRPGSAPVRPGTPVVRVRAYSLMGAISVKVKRLKRDELAKR